MRQENERVEASRENRVGKSGWDYQDYGFNQRILQIIINIVYSVRIVGSEGYDESYNFFGRWKYEGAIGWLLLKYKLVVEKLVNR